MKFGMMRGIRA